MLRKGVSSKKCTGRGRKWHGHAVLKTYAPNFVDSRETIVVIDEIQESPVIYSESANLPGNFPAILL